MKLKNSRESMIFDEAYYFGVGISFLLSFVSWLILAILLFGGLSNTRRILYSVPLSFFLLSGLYHIILSFKIEKEAIKNENKRN